MEAVKLLVVREWRRMELHPRFWIGSLVLSLLLSTATPAMLLAHYVVVVTLLGALPLGLDNPATAVETLTLPVTRRQVVTACYLWVGLTSLGLTGAMSLWNLLCRAVLPFSAYPPPASTTVSLPVMVISPVSLKIPPEYSGSTPSTDDNAPAAVTFPPPMLISA